MRWLVWWMVWTTLGGPAFGVAPERVEWERLLGPRVEGVQTLEPARVSGLLGLAAERSWNLFDLLNETGLWLKAANRRVAVEGNDLRGLTTSFDLGDHRVDTLLPLDDLVRLTLGAARGGPEVEVTLRRPVSGFLELGDFYLDTTYGFRELSPQTLGKAFGMKVKNGLFTWDVDRIVRVPDPTGKGSPNFIAIHLGGLFRPKQWHIDPVRVREQPAKP